MNRMKEFFEKNGWWLLKFSLYAAFALIGVVVLLMNFPSVNWGTVGTVTTIVLNPVWLSIAILVIGAIFLLGLRKIEARPKHVALMTRFGKPIPKVKKPGWRFFFGYPCIYGYLNVLAKTRNVEVPLLKVRTPGDNAESSIPAGYSWNVDDDDPKNLINFIAVGEDDSVQKQFDEMIAERLREWSTSEGEGPQTWEELRSADREGVSILLKAILNLAHIPSEVPTWILFKYFRNPRPKPTKSEEKIWGANWEKVEEQLEKEKIDEIKEALKNRAEAISMVRRGVGKFKIPQFGVVFNRLSIGQIAVHGKVAEAADKAEVEELERRAETLEMRHLEERVTQLMKPKSDGGLGYTREEALLAFQTERDKVKREVHEHRISVSPEVIEALPKIAGIFGGR